MALSRSSALSHSTPATISVLPPTTPATLATPCDWTSDVCQTFVLLTYLVTYLFIYFALSVRSLSSLATVTDQWRFLADISNMCVCVCVCVCVLVASPVVVEAPQNVAVHVLHNVSLPCRAIGKPSPTVTWTRSDGLALNSSTQSHRFTVQHDAALNIHRLSVRPSVRLSVYLHCTPS